MPCPCPLALHLASSSRVTITDFTICFAIFRTVIMDLLDFSDNYALCDCFVWRVCPLPWVSLAVRGARAHQRPQVRVSRTRTAQSDDGTAPKPSSDEDGSGAGRHFAISLSPT